MPRSSALGPLTLKPCTNPSMRSAHGNHASEQ
jgi:hypothetical protein